MTFTASDVSSLATSLSRWELAEYISAGLVTIGCIGEYVAEFTDWLTSGVRERKERLAKRSTLLLIAALSLEVVCLVKTNSLSGMLIGSLSEKAEKADSSANTALSNSGLALDQSSKATASASNALVLADGARREADSFEKDIVSAKTQ